ncbi:MAG: type II secretion system protein [Geobacter sp.]
MRNSKGFTLVELAVVLVIIGIILGAVIKGQDLIVNAQAKQATAAVSSWRNLTMAYLDRNGRLPGDAMRNGVIGDQTTTTTEQDAAHSAIGELTKTMQYPPANPMVVGGMNFWVYFGNTTVTSGTRNAMLVCGTENCATVFSADQIEIMKSMDSSFDGVAEAAAGQFRAVTAAPDLLGAADVNTNWKTAVFNGTGVVPVDTSVNGATGTEWAITHRAAVWLFDRTF